MVELGRKNQRDISLTQLIIFFLLIFSITNLTHYSPNISREKRYIKRLVVIILHKKGEKMKKKNEKEIKSNNLKNKSYEANNKNKNLITENQMETKFKNEIIHLNNEIDKQKCHIRILTEQNKHLMEVIALCHYEKDKNNLIEEKYKEKIIELEKMLFEMKFELINLIKEKEKKNKIIKKKSKQ